MLDLDPGGVAVAKKPELISVKIRPDVYRLVKAAAALKGVHISDWLSDVAKPAAEREINKSSSRGSERNGGHS